MKTQLEMLQEFAAKESKRQAETKAWSDTGCKCRLRTRLVGDGCPKCNPEYWAQFSEDAGR